MKPITVIFFGKSGSGKGTQSTLLVKAIENADKENKALYVETGRRFRDFVGASSSYMAKRIKEVISAGKFLPPFIPIWTWSQFFVDKVESGKEHMVFDGVCRQPEEAPILYDALKFLGREKPFVILLDVHHEEASKRLLKRGRHDDEKEKIASRLKEYETQAMPAIEFFRKKPDIEFVTINGDQTIEKVHADIVKVLGLDKK